MKEREREGKIKQKCNKNGEKRKYYKITKVYTKYIFKIRDFIMI